MTFTCWIGVHQWRFDHYSEFIAIRFVLIERVLVRTVRSPPIEGCGLSRAQLRQSRYREVRRHAPDGLRGVRADDPRAWCRRRHLRVPRGRVRPRRERRDQARGESARREVLHDRSRPGQRAPPERGAPRRRPSRSALRVLALHRAGERHLLVAGREARSALARARRHDQAPDHLRRDRDPVLVPRMAHAGARRRARDAPPHVGGHRLPAHDRQPSAEDLPALRRGWQRQGHDAPRHPLPARPRELLQHLDASARG